MGKKIWYSEPLYVLREAYKKARKSNKDLSVKEFIWTWMTPQITNPFLPDGRSVQANILISDMFYAETQKEFMHLFFVDKSLRDFLQSLPIKDFDGLMQTIYEMGMEIDGGALTTLGEVFKTGEKERMLNFGLHIPYESFEKGYAFSFTYNPEEKKLIFTWLVDSNHGYISVDEYKTLVKDVSESSKQIADFFQLAVNTLIYLNTFPDCIEDGPPKNLKEEYTASNARNITIAEKVYEMIKASSTRTVKSHPRRAYFKTLKSDFFTKKRGQTILVSETYVNGKAKTVYTAANLEEFDN